jgi:hypothetical protein
MGGSLVVLVLVAGAIFALPYLRRIFTSFPTQAPMTMSQEIITPSPTNTETLALIPTVTPTVTPTSTPVSSLETYGIPKNIRDQLPGGRVIDSGLFVTDYLQTAKRFWKYSDTGCNYDDDLQNGFLTPRIAKGSQSSCYIATLSNLLEGQAILINFVTHEAPYGFFVHLSSGQWNTPSYRSVGIADDSYPSLNPYINNGMTLKVQGTWSTELFSLVPNASYDLLMGVGYEGNFIQAIWRNGYEDSAFLNWYDLEAESSKYGGGWDNLEWEEIVNPIQSEYDFGTYNIISFEK